MSHNSGVTINGPLSAAPPSVRLTAGRGRCRFGLPCPALPLARSAPGYCVSLRDCCVPVTLAPLRHPSRPRTSDILSSQRRRRRRMVGAAPGVPRCSRSRRPRSSSPVPVRGSSSSTPSRPCRPFSAFAVERAEVRSRVARLSGPGRPDPTQSTPNASQPQHARADDDQGEDRRLGHGLRTYGRTEDPLRARDRE
jgi:hypothetical protein